MTDTYNLKLTGATLPERPRESVARALAPVMKITPEQALALLAGRETIIKRNLPADLVPRYLQAIEAAGAEVCAIKNTTTPPVQAPAPSTIDKANAGLALLPMDAPATEAPDDSIRCPACGALQPKRNLCRECGADMPRMAAAIEEAKRQPNPESSHASPYAPPKASVHNFQYGPNHPVTPPALSLSFDGRIGRTRYLAYGLPTYIPMIVGAIVGGIFMGNGKSMLPMFVFGGAGVAITLIMAFRLVVLRLHDLNLSGRWLFLPIVAGGISALFGTIGIVIVATIVGLGTLALLLFPGSYGTNDFGPPAGPNTALTVIGAILVVGLGAVSRAVPSDRITSKPPALPIQEQSE